MNDIKFGTGGFRGIIADDFTKENVKLIAQSLATLINTTNAKKEIYIGYDYRFASDFAAKWMVETLCANDIKVYISNSATPTPVVMNICKEHHSQYGIMITASHNPYYYNGVKLFELDGQDASVEVTSTIENIIKTIKDVKSIDYDIALKGKLVEEIDFLNLYYDNLEKFLNLNNKVDNNLKVLIDPIYGTGIITLRKMCEMLNIHNYKMIEDKHEAFFNFKMPNPTIKNMELIKDMVINEKYDLAIGTDSDCDRLAILDENGNYIDANEILAASYYYLVKYCHLKGDIVKNLTTSSLIDAVANKLNYKCHEVDVGFKNITSAMKKYDALVGGESSGGLTIKDYIYGKDSTFSSALFLKMVLTLKKPVSKIIEEVKEFANYSNYYYEDQINFKDKEKLNDAFLSKTPSFSLKVKDFKKINNNYKYYFDNNCFAVLRFSGTEKVIRVVCEMESKERCVEIANTLKEFVIENENN